jgi:hypothetical protein
LKGVCGTTAYYDEKGAGGDGCCITDAHKNGTFENYLADAGVNTATDYYRTDALTKYEDNLTCSKHVHIAVIIARVCVLIKVACSFGMIVYICRTCIESICLGEGKSFQGATKFGVNVLYVGFCMVTAMFVPGLSTAIAFAGVLVVVIDLVFPGMMLLAMKGATSTYYKVVAYILIIMGSLIGAISLYSTVSTVITDATSNNTAAAAINMMVGVPDRFGPTL